MNNQDLKQIALDCIDKIPENNKDLDFSDFPFKHCILDNFLEETFGFLMKVLSAEDILLSTLLKELSVDTLPRSKRYLKMDSDI